MKLFLTSILLLTILSSGFSQDISQIRVKVNNDREPLTDVLTRTENDHPVRFFYGEDWLSSFTVPAQFDGLPLDEFLTRMFLDTELSFKYLYGYAVIILKDPKPFLEYKDNLMGAVERKKIIESLTFGDKKKFVPGRKFRISGTIRDEEKKSPQASITVMLNNRVLGISDQAGNYSFSIPGGDYLLTFRSVNFEEKVIDLHLYDNAQIDVLLKEGSLLLDEVVIAGQNSVSNNIGQHNLNVTQLKRSASLLGEADVIRQIQTQPGVTSTGEVAGGFNVRGGGVDQNLVLFDDIPIFNTYHALGFFSAFNAENVERLTFHKGGIPAQFGGRVSSVLAIDPKEGDPESWHGGGGIGILSSHLFIGGPIKKDTTTIFATARGSYSDWMLETIQSNYNDLRNSSVKFFDGSLRIDHKLNADSRLSVSGYFSADAFTLSNDTSFSYQNAIASAQYHFSLSETVTGKMNLGFGQYKYKISEPDPLSAFDLAYRITYPSLKFDFSADGSHHLSFGWHTTLYEFSPGTLQPKSPESEMTYTRIPKERSVESAIYIADEFQLARDLTVTGGFRFSAYARLGAGDVFNYAPGKPREPVNVVDTVSYGTNDIMKTYTGVEPRLALRYAINDDASVKFGYNRMYQYLHLVTNSAAVTPVDIWQSSNNFFKPQVADQLSVGYYRNLAQRTFEASGEIFYKSIRNVLDFKDGAKLILNPQLETALISGKSEAYGLEIAVQKVRGRLLASGNYTYSRSLRTANSPFRSEQINEGREYASNFDQPHVFNFEWRYGISRRHFFSGNFTYHTGRPMSVPVSSYNVDGVTVINFSERNKYRLPDYHRLDLALIIEGNHKKKKVWDGTWTISLYNVYLRKNAYSVFYKPDKDGILRPYKLSIIGTMIPSISYSFKF